MASRPDPPDLPERLDALTALVVVLLAELARPKRRRSRKAARNARIVQLRAEGHRLKDIGASLQMTPEAVRAVVRRSQKAAVS